MLRTIFPSHIFFENRKVIVIYITVTVKITVTGIIWQDNSFSLNPHLASFHRIRRHPHLHQSLLHIHRHPQLRFPPGGNCLPVRDYTDRDNCLKDSCCSGTRDCNNRLHRYLYNYHKHLLFHLIHINLFGLAIPGQLSQSAPKPSPSLSELEIKRITI